MKATRQLKGTLSVFGHPSTPAELEAIAQPVQWRGLRASLFLAGGAVLTPVVALVPPHAPWAVAALGTAGYLALRKWKERFTLLSMDGACPRCGEPLTLPKRTALDRSLTLSCGACNHNVRLVPETPSMEEGRSREA